MELIYDVGWTAVRRLTDETVDLDGFLDAFVRLIVAAEGEKP